MATFTPPARTDTNNECIICTENPLTLTPTLSQIIPSLSSYFQELRNQHELLPICTSCSTRTNNWTKSRLVNFLVQLDQFSKYAESMKKQIEKKQEDLRRNGKQYIIEWNKVNSSHFSLKNVEDFVT